MDSIAKRNKIKVTIIKTAEIKGAALKSAVIRQGRKLESAVRSSVNSAKILKLLDYFETRQTVRVGLALILSFAISIAASQVLAKTNFAPGLAFNFTAKTPAQAPSAEAASGAAENADAILAVSEMPLSPSLEAKVLTEPGEIYLPMEKISLPDPLKDRRKFLRAYLKEKGSVLADHVDALSEQTQWKLIIAISRAESSFCKHHIQYNCWGVGGAWDPARYASYDQAIEDVNKLLQNKYVDQGLKTPAQIERKWVGYKSPNWQAAVQEELDNLSKLQ